MNWQTKELGDYFVFNNYTPSTRNSLDKEPSITIHGHRKFNRCAVRPDLAIHKMWLDLSFRANYSWLGLPFEVNDKQFELVTHKMNLHLKQMTCDFTCQLEWLTFDMTWSQTKWLVIWLAIQSKYDWSLDLSFGVNDLWHASVNGYQSVWLERQSSNQKMRVWIPLETTKFSVVLSSSTLIRKA